MMDDFFGDDNICRLGGDEFLILIPDKTEEETENMPEEACQKMKETFNEQNVPIRLSVSYGVVEVGKLPFAAVSDILEPTDRKMYTKKKETHKMKR